jgi:hypothetical protein
MSETKARIYALLVAAAAIVIVGTAPLWAVRQEAGRPEPDAAAFARADGYAELWRAKCEAEAEAARWERVSRGLLNGVTFDADGYYPPVDVYDLLSGDFAHIYRARARSLRVRRRIRGPVARRPRPCPDGRGDGPRVPGVGRRVAPRPARAAVATADNRRPAGAAETEGGSPDVAARALAGGGSLHPRADAARGTRDRRDDGGKRC